MNYKQGIHTVRDKLEKFLDCSLKTGKDIWRVLGALRDQSRVLKPPFLLLAVSAMYMLSL